MRANYRNNFRKRGVRKTHSVRTVDIVTAAFSWLFCADTAIDIRRKFR